MRPIVLEDPDVTGVTVTEVHTHGTDEPIQVLLHAEPGVTIRQEWKVTGEPGHGYPDYIFVWSTPRYDDPEAEARHFIDRIAHLAAGGRGWADGPHLHVRTILETPWSPTP